MEQVVFTITEFANKAFVSTRTLRYYDKKGLLLPTKHNKSGYRMYKSEDLIQLQYILSLKFLGFSLDEIKLFLQTNSKGLQEVLEEQKIMMKDKRDHLNTIINAIEETKKLLQTNNYDYNSIVKVIQVVQMEQKPHWINKYMTTEQREYLRDLAKESYSAEDLQKLMNRGWTEDDHKAHIERYTFFRKELKRLVEQEIDPSTPEAQEVGRLLHDMNNRHSQEDRNIIQGMKKSWDKYNSNPDIRRPLIYEMSDEEKDIIKRVMTVFYKNKMVDEQR